MRPAMIRSRVDLPEPDRPSSPTISPLRMVRLTSSKTTRASPLAFRNERQTRRTSMSWSAVRVVASMDFFSRSTEAQATFGVRVERPPEEAIEGGDEHAHHGDAEHDAVEVA